MIIAIVALVALELVTCLLAYFLYRAANGFMRGEDHYKAKYLELLFTFEKIKKLLADEGILLLSAEEAAKLAETKPDTAGSVTVDELVEQFPGTTAKKGTVH